MKRSHKWIVGIGTSLSLGIAAAAVSAHPGQMGGGMGPQMMGAMQHDMQGGMGPGAMHGGMGRGNAGPQTGQQLMTPEERTAIQEKMRNAATPEERRKIAEATRTEMQKRAQEKGITLPRQRGPRSGATPQAPETTEHAH